jgi:hypothetical protein
MRITITIHDDVAMPEEDVTTVVAQTIRYWKNYEGYWCPGASIVYESLGIATFTKKTDAGWAVRVYNLNTEVE